MSSYTWPDYPVTGTPNFEYNARLSQNQWVANSEDMEARLNAFDAGTGYTANSIPGDAIQTASTGTGIDTDQIEDSAVATVKIEDNAVTNDKIGPLAVDTPELVDSCVETAKVNDNAITEPKLAADNSPLNTYVLTYTSGALHWAVQGVGSASGLEALDEGNGTGWRLIGKAPANYGNIGLNAVDLSTSIFVTSTGALGEGSFCAGEETIAEGADSTATGFETYAEGDYSFSGGRETIAHNDYSVALGKYNVGTNVNSLLEIGNGVSDLSRDNVLEVHNNGMLVAAQLPTTDPLVLGAFWVDVADSRRLKVSAGP